MCVDGEITLLESILFLAIYVVYTCFIVVSSRRIKKKKWGFYRTISNDMVNRREAFLLAEAGGYS